MNDLQATTFVNQHFSFTTTNIESLPSYEDQNFRVFIQLFADNDQSESNLEPSIVLKVSRADYDKSEIEKQHTIMKYLDKHCKASFRSPRVVEMLHHDSIVEWLDAEKKTRYVRALTWISGNVIGNIEFKSKELLSNAGEFVGVLARNLANLSSSDEKLYDSYKKNDFDWDLR
jgi:Ser/Thr protein kinase RdoA (MazF antagonist)